MVSPINNRRKYNTFLLLSSILPLTATCCGITTHIVISQRSKQDFSTVSSNVDYKKLITRHHDALLAGSVYPDAFYPDACVDGRYHDIAEDTHWTGFLNATVNFIRRKYPQPWNEATEKLVVFLFGIVSHQVADILWHGLGIDQGFLVTMGKVNFHGSFDRAHNAGDIGGDIVSVFDMDVSLYMDPQKEWYIPTDDLFQIYEELYGKARINHTVIDNCTTILLLQGIAELVAGSELYLDVAEMSPFLIDQFLDFFVGGVNDMAGWGNRLWNETITMLEKGTSACEIPHNTLFVTCNKTYNIRRHKTSEVKLKNGWFVEPNLRGLIREDLEITKAYRGIIIRPGPRIRKMMKRRQQKFLLRKEKLQKQKEFQKTRRQRYVSQDDPQRRGIFYTPEPYSRLGWSLASGDIDGDGNEDLVTGAPGYGEPGSPQQGRVYILYGEENGLPTPPGAYDLVNIDAVNFTSFIKGPAQVQSRFGSSVAVLDVNLDGVLDLVVGAPAYGNNSPLDYNGAVFVYFGTPHSRMVQRTPNITITCQSKYCNLGMTLTILDFNKDSHDDLILGVPFYQQPFNQSGIVSGLASNSSYKGQMQVTLESLIAGWSIQNKQSFSWFGYNLRAKNGLLLVSQPYRRKCARPDCEFSEDDQQSVGMLNMYNIDQTTTIPGLSVMGQKQFEMAGYSADIGFPYDSKSMILAVGVPGAEHYGNVLTLPLKLYQAGAVNLYNITGGQTSLVATFEGDRQFGRFGAFVKFTDINGDGVDDLLIGAPRRNEDITDLVPRWFSNDYDGQLYTFYGGKGFPRGNATSSPSCGLYYPCPETVANFTAEAYGYKVNLGWNAVVTKSRNMNNLVISVLHGDEHYTEYSSSTLYIYRVNTTEILKRHSVRKYKATVH